MTHLEFNFGNALFHFRRTGGPAGFLRTYALAFAVLGLVIQAASVMMSWPIYEIYLRMFAEGDGIVPYADEINRASMRAMMGSLLVLPLGVLFWMVFEAASQRRYMRAEGFRLRLGPDEWRILIVGLIWIGLLIGAYIGVFVVMLVPLLLGAIGGDAGVAAGAVVAALLVIAYLVAVFWAGIRLSPAAALTIRDQDIRFFEAWRITRGKVWTLFGAWIVIFLPIFLAYILIYAAIGFVAVAMLMPVMGEGAASSANLTAAVTQPSFWVPISLLFLVMLCVQGVMQHVMSGPAALAAKTDPNWAGQPGISDTFG